MISLNILKQRISEENWYSAIFTGSGLPQAKMRLVRAALHAFMSRYGYEDRPISVLHVPGRVEVLGNHTDYAGGMVLNFASDRGFIVISAPSDARRLRMAEAGGDYADMELSLDTLEVRATSEGDRHWFIYPQRMAARTFANFSAGNFHGIDAALASDLPPASGMSSSSALMVATFLVLAAHADVDRAPVLKALMREPLELATYLGCCENGQDFEFHGAPLKGDAGVGTFGGSQDHTAILTATKAVLTLNRYCPAKWLEDVALPDDVAFVVAFSGFPSPKTQAAKDAFNLLARLSAEIPRAYNATRGARYGTAGEMLEISPAEFAEAVKGTADKETPALVNRYAHFHEQNTVIIPQAVKALRARDGAAFGKMVSRSHESCKRYLKNISAEIDAVVKCARECGALGASGFGAGFGGSAYAVTERRDAETFIEKWEKAYRAACAPLLPAAFFLCEPSAGATAMFEEKKSDM
jgi:galactokinase